MAADDQRFCGQCGTPLVASCPSCGTENPPGNKFCGSCGTALGVGEAPPPTPRVTTERRVVSVLFVDLVGFTSFSEGRDPEDVRALITEYFDLAKEAVDHFGGTVDKFIGDAVMAWWGAETSNEDDAERAVRAALEIVDRVTALGERRDIESLAARAGVMTGETSVGPGGNEKGLLLGDLVNSASRLQSLAEPGSVFVGDTTAGLVAGAIAVSPAGTHTVKGKDEPIVAHRADRVVGERGGAGRSDILEPPFVGRDSELRLLKDSLHSTGRDGRARLVSLVGQGGIGKSRLIWEFLKYVDGITEDVYWHEGRSPSYGDGLSLWALGEMIRQRADISETDADTTTLERLETMVDEFIAPDERAWVRDRLASLLGVGDSVGSERTELFAAARMLFEGISLRGTVVLVFEDLQWADPGLLEFIEELPDWSQNHPILIVTATRPDLLDRRPDWGSGRRGLASLYVAPLTDDEMTQLVRGAVPGIPDQAAASITSAAGGVPLFAVETLRMLLGDGRLVMRDGQAAVEGDLTALEVPSSVQAVIQARLDRLPTDERELARDAAVLGHSFTVGGLAALRDEDADKIERRLAGLVRHEVVELIRDPRSPERGQYQWVQSLLREVAYGRIARADRFELHLQAARYFRGLGEPELAPVAASHFVSARSASAEPMAELDLELADALDAALSRALQLHAHEQVIDLAETAAGVVDDRQSLRLLEAAARAAARLGDNDDAERYTASLRTVAEGSRDLSALHRAMSVTAEVLVNLSRAEEALAIVEPHLGAHPDLSSDPQLCRAAAYVAQARMRVGQSDEAVIDFTDTVAAAAEAHGDPDTLASTLISLGTAFAASRPTMAVSLIRGALVVAEQHGLTDHILRGLINLGYASFDPEESMAATERAFAEAKRVGDRNYATFVGGNLHGSYGWFLRIPEQASLLEDPVLLKTSPADRLHWTASLAATTSWLGDWERGRSLLEEVQPLLLEDGIDIQAKLAWERNLANQELCTGRPERAFEIFGRHLRESPFAVFLSATGMTDGAIFMKNRQHIEAGLSALHPIPGGPFTDPVRRRAELALMVLDGDIAGAVALGDSLAADFEAGPHRMDALFLYATLVAYLPAGPDRVRFEDAARSLIDRAGAPGFGDWIDLLAAS
jgi:class 3 adenylate cyclase